MSPWPQLTPVKARTIINRLPDPEQLEAEADRVSVYPGGGAPAFHLRQAAVALRDARAWLHDHGEVPA